MKKLLLTLLICLFSLTALAQEHLKFKGVPINGSLSSFVSAMKAKGLTISPLDSKYDSTIMDGDFAGMSDCQFIIIATKNNVPAKVIVVGPAVKSWYSLKGDYKKLKESLTAKYPNAVVKSYEFFMDPYYDGDGYELSAISLEKCIYCTYYTMPEGSITLELSGTSSSNCFIRLVYEDEINFQKRMEENEKRVSDDL